ncbi:hypothetical protein B7486_47860 [cyanobacterium TDX16]|nr:hypothetical protein B7486_47860 [cyanobacterium TDX16]
MNQTLFDQPDEQLQQLALTAQQHPPLTLERQRAIEQLVQAILRSGKLYRPQRGNFSSHYEEIYQEAKQDLLLYICENIDKYDPKRGDVMTWCNFLLQRRFFPEAIPKVLDSRNIQRASLSELDSLASPEETPDLNEIIDSCIESDPENLYRKTYIENYPEANFSALVKLRLESKSWQEISASFGIKISTLSSFYQRCLTKFAPKIQEHLRDFLEDI